MGRNSPVFNTRKTKREVIMGRILRVLLTTFTMSFWWAFASSLTSSWGYRDFSVSCVKHHALTNHQITTVTGVRSRGMCTARCFANPGCGSVNYAAGTKECQLSDSSKEAAADGDFVEEDGFDYCGPAPNTQWERDAKTVEITTPSPTTRVTTTESPSTTSVVSTAGATTEKPSTAEPMAPDCDTLAKYGRKSGAYMIYPTDSGLTSLKVYCDITDEDGGWIVIQKRQDGSVDFNQNWANYKVGFGDVESEFWLGNVNIKTLTSVGTWRLRIDLVAWEGETAWAEYSSFSLQGTTFQLQLGTHSGTANDSLSYHANWGFSTKDRDNDAGGRTNTPCASQYNSGWWFVYCLKVNLNGVYYSANPVGFNQGVQWDGWKDDYYSLKASTMKIKMVT